MTSIVDLKSPLPGISSYYIDNLDIIIDIPSFIDNELLACIRLNSRRYHEIEWSPLLHFLRDLITSTHLYMPRNPYQHNVIKFIPDVWDDRSKADRAIADRIQDFIRVYKTFNVDATTGFDVTYYSKYNMRDINQHQPHSGTQASIVIDFRDETIDLTNLHMFTYGGTYRREPYWGDIDNDDGIKLTRSSYNWDHIKFYELSGVVCEITKLESKELNATVLFRNGKIVRVNNAHYHNCDYTLPDIEISDNTNLPYIAERQFPYSHMITDDQSKSKDNTEEE